MGLDTDLRINFINYSKPFQHKKIISVLNVI